MDYSMDDTETLNSATIKVIGVGGAGGNAGCRRNAGCVRLDAGKGVRAREAAGCAAG